MVFITCDLTKRDGLEQVETCLSGFNRNFPEATLKIIIGTKNDSPYRCISDSQLNAFCNDKGLAVRTCSAKNGSGVEEAFRAGVELYINPKPSLHEQRKQSSGRPVIIGKDILPSNFYTTPAVEQFYTLYNARWTREKNGTFNKLFHFRSSNVKPGWNLEQIIRNALHDDPNKNNRGKQVLISLNWVNKNNQLCRGVTDEVATAYREACTEQSKLSA